jgi:hypothetical protein
MKISQISTLLHLHSLSVYIVFFSFSFYSTVAFAAHPLITDDAGTIGAGKAQLELNGEYEHEQEDGATTDTVQGAASFSYGLNESTDLIVGLPFQHVRRTDNDNTTLSTDEGFSDTSIDVKWRFYEQDNISLAIKPGLTLPTGNDEAGLGTGKASYRLFSIVSAKRDPWAFHLNLGYIRNENTQDEEKNIWHASIATTYAMSDNLTAVANIGIESNSDELAGTDPAFFLAGLIYALSEKLDLDCGIKYALNGTETDYTVLAGITWKI